jgi:hypothetical protein
MTDSQLMTFAYVATLIYLHFNPPRTINWGANLSSWSMWLKTTLHSRPKIKPKDNPTP